MTVNSIIRPPEGVADASQYPNLEAWLTTPLSGHQKTTTISKPGGMADNSTNRPPEGVADNSDT